MLKKFFYTLLLLSAIFAKVWAGSSKAVIIFDASGSMEGKINGVAKIKIAKDALKKLVKKWNPNIKLGLTVYGHRRKGDCNDIENIVSVGKVDKEQIIKSIEAISPKGKTPISRALKKAADELKYTEDNATVILISDGKETCDPDPCGTAKELKKQGIGFVAHVIGFNVNKAANKQLQCIANATGGEYFSAKNADALNSALKSIAKKVKKLEYNIQISASESKNSSKVEALHQIYKDIGGKRADKYEHLCESNKKEPCLEHVPPGKYIIVTSYCHYKVQTPVTVASKENLTKVNVITGQSGTVKISVKINGKAADGFHTFHKNINGKMQSATITSCDSTAEKPCIECLPEGNYTVQSSDSNFNISKKTDFEIKAGQVAKIKVSLKLNK